jgi:hypothetical protein
MKYIDWYTRARRTYIPRYSMAVSPERGESAASGELLDVHTDSHMSAEGVGRVRYCLWSKALQ